MGLSVGQVGKGECVHMMYIPAQAVLFDGRDVVPEACMWHIYQQGIICLLCPLIVLMSSSRQLSSLDREEESNERYGIMLQ